MLKNRRNFNIVIKMIDDNKIESISIINEIHLVNILPLKYSNLKDSTKDRSSLANLT
ncbi:hypothetical protein [Rickettsiales endosymbiont of Trichoplax sp. H2]|uniref:hypothetical protein n=1 Tax=Rickettsiales endosymbiont of Trichoplax sp. H2 TaxID=2021221 RepID=UPI0012B27B65|nr:hypothetical protein [Rickettsiales endosymbiont of Trichoplax sp. H2]MSO13816.1 hypothetical protein [Rickettsiales endosymbiont of Trichoplax sp. H2]